MNGTKPTGSGIHCARCGMVLEDYLTADGNKPACAFGLPHEFGDWKKRALPVSLFREEPLTLACIVGFLPMIATYVQPLHAAGAALAVAAVTYAVMRLAYPPLW